MTDDGLRAPWRVLLFAALFLTLLWLEWLLLPFLAGLEIADDRISAGLIAQTGLVLAAALLAAWVLLRWVEARPTRSLGFPVGRRGAKQLAAGVAVGAVSVGAVVALFGAFGWYRYTADAGSLQGWATTSGLALVALAIPAAAEEALIRGYPFRALAEGPGPATAVVVTSLVFAWLHGGNPGVGTLALINIFLAGVLLAVAVLRTGTLWLATGVHLGWNWAMSGPLDLPVSGLQGLDTPLYDVVLEGPAWATGGTFGPEGGLAGTLGAGLGLALVVWITSTGRTAGAVTDR